MCLANEELLQSVAQLKDPEELEEIVEEEIVIPLGLDLIDDHGPGITDIVFDDERAQVLDDEEADLQHPEIDLLRWPPVDVVCPMCDNWSGTYCDEFDDHLQRHLNENDALSCPRCNVYFESHDQMMRHIYSYLHTDWFPCPRCELMFEYPPDLWEHARNECFQEAIDQIDWYNGQEVRAIGEEEEASTKVVTKAPAKSGTKRLRSTKSQSGDASNPVQCDICSKILKDQNNYARHRLRHNIGRPHTCPQCNMSFVFKNDLELHVKSHDPQNYKFVCTKCDPPVKYFLKRSLKAHEMRNHQPRERKEVCLECGKRFFDVSALKKHSLIHYQKSYECEKCYIRFTRVDHLKKHMETHQRNDRSMTGVGGPHPHPSETIRL